MAKKNLENGVKGTYNSSGKQRSAKCSSGTVMANQSQQSSVGSITKKTSIIESPRMSPSRSPRTSPGLVAGHYAGCKWTEPPLPSALPLPPKHWMQTTSASHSGIFSYGKKCQEDIAMQLKVLLKVQAWPAALTPSKNYQGHFKALQELFRVIQ